MSTIRGAWLALALFLAPAAVAQVGVGPRIRLGPDCCPTAPTVGVAADGSFTVVWETHGSFLPIDIDHIQGRRFDAEGRPLGPYFLVDPWPSGYQSSPRLAVAADSSFYVTWLQEEQGAEPRLVLNARHFGTNGRADGPVFRVGTGDGGEGFFDDPPDVVVTPGGGYAAIWQRSTGGPGDERALIVRAFSPAGRPLGPEVVVAAARGPLSPALAAGARDRLVAVWLEQEGEGEVPTLLYRQLAANGEPVGPAREVRDEAEDAPLDPAVAMSRKGDFFVVWVEDPSPGDELPGGTRILSRLFDAQGNPSGPSARVSRALDPANGKPTLVADPEGGYLVAWTLGIAPPPTFALCNLVARRFRPDTQDFTTRFDVTGGDCQTFYHSALSLGLGEGRRGAATWYGTAIRARRLAPRPGP